MKAAVESLAHKSEVGGVVLNIRTPAEAAAAASRLGQLADTVLVDQMVADGVAELLVGAIVDAHFGLTLVLGAGGVLTELLNDTVSLAAALYARVGTQGAAAPAGVSSAGWLPRQAGGRCAGFA